MEHGPSGDNSATRGQIGHIVVRGEFGPLLAAALPECEITARSGETHITALRTRRSRTFGVLEHLRDFGASLISVTIDP